ncbi:hypothetical protein V8F06_012697 [Rhypophila decipiens]
MSSKALSTHGHRLVTGIWPELSLAKHDFGKQYSRFYSYYEREASVAEGNSDLCATADISKFVSLLQKLMGLTDGITRAGALEAARSVLGSGLPEDQLMRFVDMVVRLWLTLDVSSLDLRRPGLLNWTSKQTLTEVVESHFRELEHEQSRSTLQPDADIDPEFKAEFLVVHHGYTIIWTDNLASHLTIDWKHKTLCIYEHKIALYNHLRFQDFSSPEASFPIPERVLQETIDTLNLLFPFQDDHDKTKRFLAKHKKPFYGLGLCNRPRKLKLSDYSYWRGRVADLVYIASGPPLGVRQLKLSKQGDNLLQFATFWIATTVGVLTVVSIAIGVVGTVYGARQYDLALKQYDLSVMQLCADPAARERFRVCLDSKESEVGLD